MNEIQRNFKKQMAKSLYYAEKKARKGKGAFSNNLFTIRFYGENSSSDYIYSPMPKRIILFILRFIFCLIKIIVGIAFILFTIIVSLKNA